MIVDKFYNSEFDAENVLKLNFPLSFVRDFNSLLINSQVFKRLASISPPWKSDISWLSPNSLEDFKIFNKLFDQFNANKLLKEALNLEFDLILYCGFLVVRSRCEAIDFHTDWRGLGLKAFTLITPLVEQGDDLGLVYRKSNSSIGNYYYKPGEAIIFGSDFIHSTMPSKSKRKIILLSFTFGINDMNYFPLIDKCIGSQSNLYRLPNGDFRIRNLDIC
jgi:hypothetical protein